MISRDELERILGTNGAIAANHPFYEYRPGQIQMAQGLQMPLSRINTSVSRREPAPEKPWPI